MEGGLREDTRGERLLSSALWVQSAVLSPVSPVYCLV